MKIFLFCICTFLLLASCENNEKAKTPTLQWSTQKSIKVNHSFSREENMQIKLFIQRRKKANFQKTGTGLRYWIYDDKEGETVKEYQHVNVQFEISLLDGTVLYATDSNEVSSFKVDKSYVESGIMEGVKYMSEGDRAIFIIPSNLGHGLLGDFHKIPPLSVLVVDMKILKILENEN